MNINTECTETKILLSEKLNEHTNYVKCIQIARYQISLLKNYD